MGGIDKRAMISGPQAIDKELGHILPLFKEGGFIPWCDHHVPPDVPLQHYLYYVKRMKQASLNPDQFLRAALNLLTERVRLNLSKKTCLNS